MPRWGRHFTYTQERIEDLNREGRLRINAEIFYNDLNGNRIEGRPEYLQTETVPIDNNWTDIKGYAFSNNYPTENHEELLERVGLNPWDDSTLKVNIAVLEYRPSQTQQVGRILNLNAAVWCYTPLREIAECWLPPQQSSDTA